MATSFYNAKTVSVNGVSITEVTSIDVTFGASMTQHTVDASDYAAILAAGAKTLSGTVNGQDPSTLLSAAVATPAEFTWVMTRDCDATGAPTFTLADGTNEDAVGESFEFDSGGPGEVGTGSATFVIVGLTSANLATYKTDYEGI